MWINVENKLPPIGEWVIGKCTHADKLIAVLVRRTEDDEWECIDPMMKISDVTEWIDDGTLVECVRIKDMSIKTIGGISELISQFMTKLMLLVAGDNNDVVC